MSTESARLRHVGAKSGVFVLAAVVVVAFVLLLAARAQWWFAATRPFVVRLPADGAYGLRAGSAVELLGVPAGWVDDVHIGDDGSITARVEVRERLARFVRADSACTIRKRTLDLGGDAYLQIARGSGAELPAEAVLACRAEPDVMASFGTLLEGLSSELRPALAEVRDAAHEFAALARELRDPDGAVHRLLARLDELARQTGEGQGVATRLLHDPNWAAEVDASLRSLRGTLDRASAAADRVGDLAQDTGGRANALLDRLAERENGIPAALVDLRALLAELRPVVADLARAAAALPAITTAARDEVRGLPGIVQRSQTMLGELEKVVLAAQRHWLLRGYVAPAPPTSRPGGEGLGNGR